MAKTYGYQIINGDLYKLEPSNFVFDNRIAIYKSKCQEATPPLQKEKCEEKVR